MTDRLALFEALQASDLEGFAQAFLRSGRGPASRHALRIDGTRFASSQVRADDGGRSSLAFIGFAAGLLLSDRLSGPLAPFARPTSATLANAQALWCLRGEPAGGLELPDLLFIGDLPQDLYALSHALYALVKERDAIQAAEVVERLIDRGIERERLVALLARVATERSDLPRPAILLSSALQLCARLGGDEIDTLLRAMVRGTIAAYGRPPAEGAPPPLPSSLEEELPQLLANQVGAAGVTDLRRIRGRVRADGATAAWQAIEAATRARVGWLPLVDIMSLVMGERLLRVRTGPLTAGGPLAGVLETLAQVRAVRWLIAQYPSPHALKALFQLASQVGWLEHAMGPEEPVMPVTEQNPTRLLVGLRQAFQAGDRAAASGYVARYRELNLPREALAGALVEEAVRGGQSVEATALRLIVAEAALAEAEALFGSMEEGMFYQGLARILTMIPPDLSLAKLMEGRA